MADTSNLQITYLEAAQSQKEVSINAGLDAVDGLVDSYDLSTTGGTTVVTEANARKGAIRVTGVLASGAIVELPVDMNGGHRLVINATTGAFTVQVRYGPAGTLHTVTQGASAVVADTWKQEIPSSTFAGLTGALAVAFDGGGSDIAVGSQVRIHCPFGFTLNEWTLLADASGSIVIDVWKDTYANYPPTNADSITNGSEPELSTADKAQDTDISDWTTVTVSAGDTLIFNVDSCSGITNATLILKYTRTA